MAWLLDTNILGELKRPRPEPRVRSFLSRCAPGDLYISVVTLAEIRFGIERLEEGGRRQELRNWLTGMVRPMFAGRILPFGEDVALLWRQLLEEGRKQGHTYDQPDVIIAATALHFGLTVVTRDTSEFAYAKVPFLNPWEQE